MRNIEMKLCLSGRRLLVNSLILEADGQLPDYRYSPPLSYASSRLLVLGPGVQYSNYMTFAGKVEVLAVLMPPLSM